MKLRLVTAAVLSLGLAYATANADQVSLKTDTDKLSYTIGNNMGNNFKQQGIQINQQALMQGLQDGLSGATPALSLDQQKAVITKFQQEMQAKMKAQMEAEAAKNAKASKAFLKDNAKKSGVKTTSSGLQYQVVTAGDGPKPGPNDVVTVDYEGKLLNGKVFDSSYQRGKPVSFPVNGVIPGWTEALKMMPVGSTWMLYIPPALAYKEQGIPGVIPPNEVLIFKVHLISIQPGNAAAAPAK